ncbi:MAG: ATP-binding protein, partial [Pseudomonadota bacterium]
FAEGLGGGPKRVGEILIQDGKITRKDLDEALAGQKPIGRILVEEGKLSETDLHNALQKQDLMTAAQQLAPAGGAEPEMRTMRVDEAKVEGFSNLVGELFVARNTYEYLLYQLGAGNGNAQAAIRSLQENLHLFSRLTSDMHHGVMSLRMIPVRGTFQKFNRVVRDISRKEKKLIDLAMEGEDIEIDKKVADMLFDPLVHIVRNACDHGIELPEERRAAGKPENGTVILKASQEGNRIKIDVVDDGRGISRTKVYEKAKKAGIPVDSIDDPALLELIFMPGFSTKAEVTDLSGRGVGMDVVKTTMDALGGTAQVTSEEGRGSEISLSIPMTMGISAALIVEAGGTAYAIPLDRIVETEKIARGKLRMIGNQALFYYRGEVLPAKGLQALLDPDSAQTGNDNTRVRHGGAAEEIAMVIVKTLTGKLGVVVDRFVENTDVAIKPVPGALAGIDVISGVSIMGDGRVLLVLNPERF